MGQHIERLARLVAETPWQAIPPEVHEHAKLVFLDTLGVVLAGSTRPEVRKLTAQLLNSGGCGATVYGPGFPTADPRTAALLNGIAGRSIELCEGHRFVSCQAAVQILPTVLALGEAAGRGGREALAALVLGYEAAVRVARAATARRLAHQNGQAALIGAIAAGARLRGLDAARVSRAMRIGAVLVLTPSYSNVVVGATALNVAGGMSGFAGVLAPDLALAGFEARDDAIEEAFAELVGDGFAPDRLDEQLGQGWEIARDYLRLRACCSPIYSALDALEEALADLHPRPDEIERIDVATYAFAAVMNAPDPPNEFAAHYSLPHAAAAIVVHGDAGLASFSEPALRDPAFAAIRRRVHVREDPELTKQAPRLKPARVTLTLKDGRASTRTCESARGDFQRPYPREALLAKFRDLAGMVLTPGGVRETEALVDCLDRIEHLAQLPALLRHHTR